MDESICKPDAGEFELGEILGRRQAFSAIAGRCSAADAACLRRMRDEKLFKLRAETWEAFCPKYLGMSKALANRIIRWLEEFGPEYFELAQLTRITADQFRAIAPAVHENSIHWHEEAIALIPENAERVVAAVEELRRAAALPAAEPATERRLSTLERDCSRLAAEFQKLVGGGAPAEERLRVAALLAQMRSTLARLEPRMGR